MNLSSAFWGAAGLATALAGPGAYYMTQPSEVVRARVTGRQQADTHNRYGSQKYFIYTDEAGKLDTFALSNGSALKENCVYAFNLKGARLQPWPVSYSRSITGYSLISCP